MGNYIYQGHIVRKRFGQNFLCDSSVISSIVSIIKPKPEQVLIEIGPGFGALTDPISVLIDNLTVVELDKELSFRLKSNSQFGKKLSIFQGDVMHFNFASFAREKSKLLRVFGNLPYNIFTPLIFYLFNYINLFEDMHFMVQKEVMERLVAKPGTKAYGRLSVMAQYYCQISSLLEVSRTSFSPSPKVDSVFARFLPYKEKSLIYKLNNIRFLNKITVEAFSQRRKILRNSLSCLFSVDCLKKLKINPDLRAENLTVAQYCELANYLSECI